VSKRSVLWNAYIFDYTVRCGVPGVFSVSTAPQNVVPVGRAGERSEPEKFGMFVLDCVQRRVPEIWDAGVSNASEASQHI
jgi:hypothetical protein